MAESATFVDFIEFNHDVIKERLKESIPYSKFPVLSLPPDFTSIEIKSTLRTYSSDLRSQIEPLSRTIESFGFSPSVYTALYEASLNAIQHGNQFDPAKRVRISSLVSENSLELIIEDQGKCLPEYFIPFLLKVRKEISGRGDFVDWYSYSLNPRNSVNNGTGTSFIHTYMDKVKYMRSKDLGGLAVYLFKEK